METERGEGTPRGELTRIRSNREKQDSAVAERIAVAMLEACGEKGFRAVAVQNVIDRYGGNRVQFYRHFASKADCYAAAYDAQIEKLCERLLDAARAAPGWRPGLRAALLELARFLAEQPLLARGLLVEVHVAGEPALSKRAEVADRLVAAIDAARGEKKCSLPDPPPLTARFMLGAIESAATSALARGEAAGFAASVPDLAHLVVAAYFGEDAAAEELAASGGSGRARRAASSAPR
jgi:AcrR family transcriptional regulator